MTVIRENDLTAEVFDSVGTVAIMANGIDLLHIGARGSDGSYTVAVFPTLGPRVTVRVERPS